MPCVGILNLYFGFSIAGGGEDFAEYKTDWKVYNNKLKSSIKTKARRVRECQGRPHTGGSHTPTTQVDHWHEVNRGPLISLFLKIYIYILNI